MFFMYLFALISCVIIIKKYTSASFECTLNKLFT